MFASHNLIRTARYGSLLVAVAALSACATMRPTANGNIISTTRPAAVSVDGAADWAWDVSGDAVVRPLQVFSLSGQTYFQMLPKQRIPAVFVNGTPVPFTIAPPYLIVKGVPQRFDLMADGYRAVVIHRGPVAMPNVPAVERTDRVHRVQVGTAPSASVAAPASPTANAVTAAPGTIGRFIADTRPTPVREIAHPQVDVAKAEPAATTEEVQRRRVWRITPSQRTLSRALAQWSKEAGVKLVWKSDVDLPIEAPAEYHVPKFFAAMSSLLSDADTAEYHFFYSVTGGVVTVISVKQS